MTCVRSLGEPLNAEALPRSSEDFPRSGEEGASR